MKRALTLALALLACAPAFAAPRNPLDALRLKNLTATRARPLFAPSRRPPAPPPAQLAAPLDPEPVLTQAAPPAPPPFELIGAAVGEGVSYVLLRQRATSKVMRLRPGDDAEGWRVGAIGIRSVVLERDGRSDALALTPTSPTAALAATPAAAEVAVERPDDVGPAPPASILRRLGHRTRN
jgi:general secretion pathway protein N